MHCLFSVMLQNDNNKFNEENSELKTLNNTKIQYNCITNVVIKCKLFYVNGVQIPIPNSDSVNELTSACLAMVRLLNLVGLMSSDGLLTFNVI